jgi:tyrosyl-tRNA synthetase
MSLSLVKHLAARPQLQLHLQSQSQLVCRQGIRRQPTLARGLHSKGWPAQKHAHARQADWQEQADRIRSGAQPSMLSVLEERGFVKDVAG